LGTNVSTQVKSYFITKENFIKNIFAPSNDVFNSSAVLKSCPLAGSFCSCVIYTAYE
jgi:hypothetical protein